MTGVFHLLVRPRLWNSLPVELHQPHVEIGQCRWLVKTFLFDYIATFLFMSALEAIFLTCLLLSVCYVKWVICRFTCTVFELLLDKADSTLFHKVAADSRPVLHQLYRHFCRPHRTIVCVIELISSACQTTQDALWIVTFLLGPCSRMFINFVLSPLFNSLTILWICIVSVFHQTLIVSYCIVWQCWLLNAWSWGYIHSGP